MTSSSGELSVTQPGRAARARVLARRMAAVCYRTLFGAAPETTAAGDSGPQASRPGEVVLAQEGRGEDVVLILIRSAGEDGEARWWNAVQAAEALAASPYGRATLGPLVPLPRAATGPGDFVCGTATGPEGTVRVLTRNSDTSGRDFPPTFDEAMHFVVATDPPTGHRAMWASSGAQFLLEASGDHYVARFKEGEPAECPQLLVGGRSVPPTCGFRFPAAVFPLEDGAAVGIREIGPGAGFGPVAGWRATLATADGVLLIDAQAEDDATTELEHW